MNFLWYINSYENAFMLCMKKNLIEKIMPIDINELGWCPAYDRSAMADRVNTIAVTMATFYYVGIYVNAALISVQFSGSPSTHLGFFRGIFTVRQA